MESRLEKNYMMISLSDGIKTREELHDDRTESTNVESFIHLDNWCITDEVPTQAEIEIYYHR